MKSNTAHANGTRTSKSKKIIPAAPDSAPPDSKVTKKSDSGEVPIANFTDYYTLPKSHALSAVATVAIETENYAWPYGVTTAVVAEVCDTLFREAFTRGGREESIARSPTFWRDRLDEEMALRAPQTVSESATKIALDGLTDVEDHIKRMLSRFVAVPKAYTAHVGPGSAFGDLQTLAKQVAKLNARIRRTRKLSKRAIARTRQLRREAAACQRKVAA
jgi:hypothetical protein